MPIKERFKETWELITPIEKKFMFAQVIITAGLIIVMALGMSGICSRYIMNYVSVGVLAILLIVSGLRITLTKGRLINALFYYILGLACFGMVFMGLLCELHRQLNYRASDVRGFAS